MRPLQRDLITIHYSLYEDIDTTDEWGNPIKEYGTIQSIKANLSANRGEASAQVFGNDVKYDREMTVYDKGCKIDENTRLWIKNDINEEYDYIVKKVADTANIIRYAIEKVNVKYNENNQG